MKTTGHIFRKEMREMLRDKRVLSSAVIGPVFLIVLFLMLFGFLQKTLTKPKSQTLHVVRTGHGEAFAAELEKKGVFKIQYVETAEAGEKLVREGKAKAVLYVPDEMALDINAGKAAHLKVTFDPDQPTSPIILGQLGQMVTEASKARVAAIMDAQGLDKSLAEPIVLDRVEIKKEKAMAGQMIVGLLPYLIVIWAFYGGFSIVTDLGAGEKEKNTLETLLISPVKRSQIALGKFFALMMVCLASSMTSLIGVLVVGSLNIPLTKGLFPEGVHLTFLGIVSILGAIVPLAAFFAGILLAISAYARNTREAQTYLTLVSFIVLMPAVFSQFIGFTDFAKAQWVNFVPILNSAGVIREAMLGKFEVMPLLITVGTSLFLAYLALRLTIHFFEREEVLARI